MPHPLLIASRVLLVIALVSITLLSLSPSAPSAPGGNDKIAHLLAYAAVAFLLVLSARRAPDRVARLFFYLAAATLYGVVIEVLQQFTGREFDVMDMAANALGALIGTLLGLVARRVVGSSSGTADRRPSRR